MTQQIQKTYEWVDLLDQDEDTIQEIDSQPIFFFDGDFRTWRQVEQRVQFNWAIAVYATKTKGS